MDFGHCKSKFQEVPETGATFLDITRADQAKLELQEVVDFLKNPVGRLPPVVCSCVVVFTSIIYSNNFFCKGIKFRLSSCAQKLQAEANCR